MAIYANFSMHPDTVGGTKASADYPGALGRILAGYHGNDCITLYGNGTCGNLNHLDVNWPRAQKGPEEAHRLGALIAAAIFRAEKTQRDFTPGVLRVKSVTVPLDVPFVSPEQEELARETVRKKESGPQPSFMQLVHANRLLDLAPRQGKPIEAEVQVITLGKEVAWIALPGEVFVELGIALKKRSPFTHTIITTLANGNEGYIPDRRSYAEKAYEAESARVEPGSGEKLVDAAAAILTELHSAN
jgi:neutral ceramidase